MRNIYNLFFLLLVGSSFAQKVVNTPAAANSILTDPVSVTMAPGFSVKSVSGSTFRVFIDNNGNGIPDHEEAALPSLNENFIRTIECLDLSCSKKKETVVYFDGLGREKQALQVAGSSTGKTLVTPYEYDGFGRQAKEFLPFPLSDGTNKITTQTDGSSFYSTLTGDTTPYSEKTFENSPLNRVLAQAAPGESWKKGTHEIKFDYQTNTVDNVLRFDVSLNGSFVPSLIPNGNYPANTLYKTVTTDENGQPIEEFKDQEGRIVLKRISIPKKVGAPLNSSGNHDTYYVYDVYGNLTYVLPPKLIEVGNYTANLAELGYQYQYDEKNRLVEKQLPGKGREFMVYDNQDRLTLQQDANQRTSINKGWTFFKYDKFGRVVYSGFFKNGATRASMQTALNNKRTKNNEERTTSAYTNNGASIYYSNNEFPNGSLTVQSVNYYDNYENLGITPSSIDNQVVVQVSDIKTKGLAVASLTNVLGTTTWNKAFTFYDEKYVRPIATNSTNYLGGYTNTASILDFRAKVSSTITKHKLDNLNSNEVTVKEVFDYYDNELLKSQTHQVNNEPVEYIAQNTYNEINQLITKKVGNTNASNPLQQIDYKYNIRGWMTDINNVDVNDNRLFAFRLNYDKLTRTVNNSTIEKLYNGNISETIWKTSPDHKIRSYSYSYDKLNRLVNSVFIKEEGTERIPDTYNEKITGYDKNGNILGIERNGETELPNKPLIDNLVYDYPLNSNKLLNVTDDRTNEGFNDGNKYRGTSIGDAGNDYDHDLNGNLTKDLNKEITKISYNDLNLPVEVLWNVSKKINYVYDASGVKLRKVVTNGTVVTTTDYAGGFQYKDKSLQFFPTSEGYVNVTGGTAFNYVYNYTDHLGNVRLSYQKETNGTLKILEENNYYPFGLKHSGYDDGKLGNQTYNYKYNGQEFQDELSLNWYNYRYRNYDPTIGRFFGVDPISEDYYNISTYQFAHNNPVWKIEIEGLEGTPTTNQDIQSSAGNNRDPELEFLEMTAGSINSIRAAFSNLVGRGINTLTNNNIDKKYEVENGALVLYKDVPKETTEEKIINTIGDVATLALTAIGGVEGALTAQGGKSILTNTVNDAKKTAVKTYQTYTKTNPITKEVYSGKTSGTGTALQNIAKRDKSHHMNDKGFGPAILDKSSTNKNAIRGREQYLIYKNGGAKSQDGTSGNAINGISPNNKNRTKYLNAAKVFGL